MSAKPEKDSYTRDVYRLMIRTYGRRPMLVIAYIAECYAVIVMRVIVVIYVAKVTAAVAEQDFMSAERNAIYFLAFYISSVAVGAIGDLLAIQAEQAQYGVSAAHFHRKLIHKDMAFYRDHQTGYLATVFRQHLDSMVLLARFFRGEALGTTISLIVPVIVLLLANLKVGLLALAIVLVQVVYVIWSSSRVRVYRKRAHEFYRQITGEVSDELTNIVAFKSGGIEDEADSRVGALLREENWLFLMRQRVLILLDFPRGVVTAIGITGAVFMVIEIARSSSKTAEALGLMVLTLTYMFQIVRNVYVVPSLIQNHDDLVTKMGPTLEYLGDSYETIRDPDDPVELKIGQGEIDIKAISFSYESHAKESRQVRVFKDFDLRIAGGEQVGVVGLSGAGKSTLASLLMRFDEINDGLITIDGIDIRSVRQSDLRHKIAYVPQEPILFHRTVRENIAYYNSDASWEEIQAAAKAAHADGFIHKLPDGYDTMVGERGVKLSGGQKQRIAIARAILKKAPIMIFDEATSALDSESEQIVQRALPEILGKQTALIIAHRLSTIAKLDRIVVMHDGQIAEEGTHEQLLDAKGRYYKLWQRQVSGSVEDL